MTLAFTTFYLWKNKVISVLLMFDQAIPAKTAARGESGRGDESEPQRLTDSVGPPEDANEISGGRTKTHKHCFHDMRLPLS